MPPEPQISEAVPGELNCLDLAVYAAIAATPSPTLDRAFCRISYVADHSKVWLASGAVLACAGGAGGRRAAVNGLASTALTSVVAFPGCRSSTTPTGASAAPGSARTRLTVERVSAAMHVQSRVEQSSCFTTAPPNAARRGKRPRGRKAHPLSAGVERARPSLDGLPRMGTGSQPGGCLRQDWSRP